MGNSTRVNSRKIRGTAKEDLSGETTASTRAAGTAVSRAASDTILTNTASRERVSGSMVDVRGGSTRKTNVESLYLNSFDNLSHNCLLLTSLY